MIRFLDNAISAIHTHELRNRAAEELRNLAVGGLVLLALVTLFGFGAELHPYLDWFAHFRAIYILFAVAAAVVLAVQRRPEVVGALALLVANAIPVAPYLARPVAQPACAPTVSALSINAYGEASDHDALLALIEAEDPDILWVSELREPLKNRIVKDYPDHVWRDYYEHYGLFSKYPIEGGRFELAPNGRPTFNVVVITPHGPLRVIGAHPSSPSNADAMRNRNVMLGQIADAARASVEPVLLLGDLNTTMFSPHYRALEDAGLVNARAGRGVQPTWPNYSPPPLRIPIDHVMATSDVEICEMEVGEDFGSDHLPLRAAFRF